MKFLPLIFALTLTACGTTRSQRMILYGTALDIAGQPEIGEPLRALAKTFAKQPVKNVNP
jgi:hypothetical protein